MTVRRALAWISTAMVAIAVALALPVSQLRTVAIVKACCCPDPTACHCPDHRDAPDQPTMRACHSSERAMVAPGLPAFHPPVVAVAVVAIAVARAPMAVLPAPHPAPVPTRPDAPS